MTLTAAPVPVQRPSTDVDKSLSTSCCILLCLSEALKSHFLLMLSEPRHPKSTNFYTVYSVYASTPTTQSTGMLPGFSKRQFMQQHLLYADSNCLLLWIKGFLRSWGTIMHFSQTTAGTVRYTQNDLGSFVCTGMEQNCLLEEDYEHKEHSSLWGLTAKHFTFVMPRTPMLGLEEVDPFPVPNTPSRTQERPSMKIPL